LFIEKQGLIKGQYHESISGEFKLKSETYKTFTATWAFFSEYFWWYFVTLTYARVASKQWNVHEVWNGLTGYIYLLSIFYLGQVIAFYQQHHRA
jgi:hypothetical protein